MDDFETRLTGLLRERAATARPFDQLDSVVDPFDEPAAIRSRGRRSAVRPLLAAAATVAVIIGLMAILGRDTPEPAGDEPNTSTGRPPLASGLPETGIAWRPQDSLVLTLANEVLTHECMVAKGWQYPLRTAESYATGFGGWEPDEILGIVAPAGARATGYHDADLKATDPMEMFANSLSEAERSRFYEDLVPQGPLVDITGPDGSVLSQRGDGGCFGEVTAALNPLSDSQEGLRQSMEQLLLQPDVIAAAVADPTVTAALAEWSACVETAIGETAATPNELARRYAFEGDAPTAHEIDVAVADATCQADVDLWHVYHVALAKVQRATLGDRVDDYDELTQQRVALIALAEQILADRGVEVPSLD